MRNILRGINLRSFLLLCSRFQVQSLLSIVCYDCDQLTVNVMLDPAFFHVSIWSDLSASWALKYCRLCDLRFKLSSRIRFPVHLKANYSIFNNRLYPCFAAFLLRKVIAGRKRNIAPARRIRAFDSSRPDPSRYIQFLITFRILHLRI